VGRERRGKEEVTPLLLDTNAAIWITQDSKLADSAVKALDQADDEGVAVLVSPITAWEVGLLVARGRIALPTNPDTWFQRLLEAPNIRLAEMPAKILIASSFLPNLTVKDLADRILVATAREFGFALITRDRALLDYAEAGHLKAIAC
jgi:PIN domain nuclease of toxin-antitoxin system